MVAYHNSGLMSRARMQESEGWHKAAAVRGSPAKAAPTSQAPAPFLSPTPQSPVPSSCHLKPFLLTPDFLAAGATAVILNARHHFPVMRPSEVVKACEEEMGGGAWRPVIQCRPQPSWRKELIVAKVLRCRDLGMNCPKEIRAQSEEELLKLAAEHAEKDHGFPTSMIPPSIMAMVKASIKDE